VKQCDLGNRLLKRAGPIEDFTLDLFGKVEGGPH
jgi:hypothetical protein